MVKPGHVDYLQLVWVNELAATDQLRNMRERIQRRIALLDELEQHIASSTVDISNLLAETDD